MSGPGSATESVAEEATTAQATARMTARATARVTARATAAARVMPVRPAAGAGAAARGRTRDSQSAGAAPVTGTRIEASPGLPRQELTANHVWKADVEPVAHPAALWGVAYVWMAMVDVIGVQADEPILEEVHSVSQN